MNNKDRYLDHLDGVEQGEGEGGQHDQHGAQGEEEGADARRLFTVWTSQSSQHVPRTDLTWSLPSLTGATVQTNPIEFLHGDYGSSSSTSHTNYIIMYTGYLDTGDF